VPVSIVGGRLRVGGRGARSAIALAMVAALAACSGSDGPTGSRALDDSPIPAAAPVAVTEATTSTTAMATTTTEGATTTAPPLPVPIPPPPNPRAAEPKVVIGRIEIPRIKLKADLLQGVTLTTLDQGPGWWPGTAKPGQRGNVVVAGHRVTHSHPFLDIDRLVEGDFVVFTMTDGSSHTYTVTSHEIVAPTAVQIVNQTDAFTATLFACHPKHSAAFRYVVHLALAS
jgi:sortase A